MFKFVKQCTLNFITTRKKFVCHVIQPILIIKILTKYICKLSSTCTLLPEYLYKAINDQRTTLISAYKQYSVDLLTKAKQNC